jgi:hypothetical protein
MSAMKLLFIPALAATSLALGVTVFASPGGPRLRPGSRRSAAAAREGRMPEPAPGLTTQNFRVQSQEQE